MKSIRNKLKKKGGFTLIEMLIVIAIIVILIAISIPAFNSALDKARETTDAANLHSAEVIATICAMDGKLTDRTTPIDDTETYFYDIDNGSISRTKPAGQGQSSVNNGRVIQVTFAARTLEPSVEWVS